jgi:hypothetical protein
VTCASKSLAEGGALQELSHLILSAGLTLAVVAREKASPLDGRARVRFTPFAAAFRWKQTVKPLRGRRGGSQRVSRGSIAPQARQMINLC